MSRLLLAFLATVVSATTSAEAVFVSGGETGQGFLRQRGDDCYLITPYHVLGGVSQVEIVGARAMRAHATLERRYAPDLAILRVEGDLPCPKRFPDGNAANPLMDSADRAYLVSRSPSGTIRQSPVEIIGNDERFIALRPIDGRLQKGMSGSQIRVGGSTIGLLQSVDPNSGTGKALRQDYLGTLLKPWFPDSTTQTRPYASGTVAPIIESNDLDGLLGEGDEQPSKRAPARAGALTPRWHIETKDE